MVKVITPEFVVSYPNVFKPQLNTLSNKEEYSLVALFKKGTDLSVLKAAEKTVIEKKWGTDPKKWPKNLRSPFRGQGEKAKTLEDGRMVFPTGYEEGALFMNLKSKQRPGLVDAQNNDIISESEFYAGCIARASIQAYAYDQAGNRGVSFGLQNIQKKKEGEPLSGRMKPQDEFEAVKADGTSLFE